MTNAKKYFIAYARVTLSARAEVSSDHGNGSTLIRVTVGGSNPNEAGWLPIRVEKLKLIIIAVKRV